MSEETNAEKFERLSTARSEKVLQAMVILQKCANPRDYDYTPQEAAQLIGSLQSQLDEMAEAFGVDPDAEPVPSDEDLDASEDGDEEVIQTTVMPTPTSPERAEHLVDLNKLRDQVRYVDGQLMRVGPGDMSQLDVHHAGPRLGLALEAAMDGDSRTCVSLLSDVLRT